MRSSKSLLWIAILAVCLIPGGFAFSSDFSIHGDSIEFITDDEAGTLSISGPDDFSARQSVKANEAALLSLFNKAGGELADGTYNWEFRAQGKAAGERGVSGISSSTGEVRSGVFTIVNGSVVNPKAIESLPNKDQQILDDLIVVGSICAGQDCNNGESFGFDTLRLKENNLRIRAQDTSNSASFPNRDWQITFNDSSNGGANKFSIDDIDGGRTPFTIEAGAPTASLFVDDGGRIGIGKSTPVVEMHIVDGNTPTVRLEQDGSDGFTPQTWDLAGNEANFFIRDATNGSALALRIFPGSGTANALNIAANGDIGFGTTSPSEELHIAGGGTSNAAIRLQAGSGGDFTIRSQTSSQLQIRGDFLPFRIGQTAQDNLLNVGTSADGMNPAPNEVNISGNLFIFGSCNANNGGPCDGVFQPDYPIPSIEEHASFMWENSYLPAVGPTPDGETMINVFEKTTGILNELEKAHIYIEQLHNRLKAKDAVLTDIQTRLQALEGTED